MNTWPRPCQSMMHQTTCCEWNKKRHKINLRMMTENWIWSSVDKGFPHCVEGRGFDSWMEIRFFFFEGTLSREKLHSFGVVGVTNWTKKCMERNIKNRLKIDKNSRYCTLSDSWSKISILTYAYWDFSLRRKNLHVESKGLQNDIKQRIVHVQKMLHKESFKLGAKTQMFFTLQENFKSPQLLLKHSSYKNCVQSSSKLTSHPRMSIVDEFRPRMSTFDFVSIICLKVKAHPQ